MNLTDAVKSCLQKYATFSGRAPRSEYWYFYLFYAIASTVIILIDAMMGSVFLTSLFVLAVFLPFLSVFVRRLHDIDKSGWFFFLAFIPLVGPIILLIWNCTKGTEGPNRFGPDPLA